MQSVIQQQIAAYCGCIHEWNASYEENAKSVGLSYASLSVLSTAYSVKNCTQKTLCELCFLPKQSVHSIITAFYQKGWIYLQELPEDRRTKIIHFTDKGRIC